MALRTGRPVRLVLTLEETFQAVRRGASEVRVRTGFRRDGTLVFRDIEANYLIGAYADIADRTVAKGSYTSDGPYRTPAVRIVARSVLSHTTPSTAFRGFGNPQQIWAVESNMDEAAARLGIDPRRAPAAQPRRARRPVHPRRHAGRRRLGGDRASAPPRLIGWGRARPAPPGRGRGIAVGLKSGPTTGLSYSTVRLLADGSVVVYAGTSDMGQGARTIFAQIAAQELGVADRLGDGRHGRHRGRALRPADVGQPVVGADGQRRPRRLPRHPGQGPGDGRAARRRRRGGHHRRPRGGPRRRPRPAHPRRADRAASAGSAARSSASARCARRPTRTIRSAAPRPSTSSTARPSRSRSTARPATSTVAPARDRVGRRARPCNPTPGPRPGRGRRGHGPRPHADGALPARRHRADPEPRRDRLPDPDEHGPAAADGERHRRERATAPGRTARRA